MLCDKNIFPLNHFPNRPPLLDGGGFLLYNTLIQNKPSMIINGHEIKPGADLRGAKLKWSNLKGANLRGANLTEANLTGADLEGAYLGGANVKGTILENNL